MAPVLKNPESGGLDPVYWVFNGVSDKTWANMTVWNYGEYGQEYPKTFGHYHPDDAPDETYLVVEGEGILLLQKKYQENGIWFTGRVEEVLFIKAKMGDKIVINKDYGHSWSNIGGGPLITFDDWRIPHTPSDYREIEKHQGMAYYLIKENGQPKAIPNPKYSNLPEPKWVSAEEFSKPKLSGFG